MMQKCIISARTPNNIEIIRPSDLSIFPYNNNIIVDNCYDTRVLIKADRMLFL